MENYDEYIIDELTGRLNYSTYEGHLWNSIYAALTAVKISAFHTSHGDITGSGRLVFFLPAWYDVPS